MKLAERYLLLAREREHYLLRGRRFAALSVPSVCPPEGTTSSSILVEGYQSFGSRAAKNLASKILLTQLPPGGGAFKLGVPVETLVQSGELSLPPEIARPLALCEALVQSEIERLKWRRTLFLSHLHLIVVGNVCEYIRPDGSIKLFRLDQYVANRDADGTLLEVILAEKMRVRALPQDLRRFVREGVNEDEMVTLYTRFERDGESAYKVRQDLDDTTVKPEERFVGLMPINALRWSEVPGESYGRSHVEDNYNDLMSLEGHAKNLQEAGAASSKHYIFVRPNAAGGNLRKRIAESRNGSVLSANNEDVNGFSLDMSGAMQQTSVEIERLTRSLSAAFLMTSELRRDAERVTAYELSMLSQELDTALGGVHSLMAVEMRWRLQKLIQLMVKARKLPEFPEGQIDITVTTGIEALGRDETFNRVRRAFELLGLAGPFAEDVKDYVKFDRLLTPAITATGFADAIRTADEVDARVRERAEREAMMAAAQAAAGPIAQAAVAPEAQ